MGRVRWQARIVIAEVELARPRSQALVAEGIFSAFPPVIRAALAYKVDPLGGPEPDWVES